MIGCTTIRAKLTLMMAAVMLLIAGLGVYDYYALSSIAKEGKGIAERRLPMLSAITDIELNQLAFQVRMQRAFRVVTTAPDQLSASLQDFESYGQKVEDAIADLTELGEKAAAETHSPASRELYLKLVNEAKKVGEGHHAMLTEADALLKQLGSGAPFDEAKAARLEQGAKESRKHLQALYEEIAKYTVKGVDSSAEMAGNAQVLTMVLMLAALAVGGGLSFTIAQSINRNIKLGIVSLQNIAGGDLRTPVPAGDCKDEIGTMLVSLEGMRQSLNSAMLDIDRSATGLASASEQMAVTNEETTQGVSKQQHETDMLATAINEMSATVREVAHNTATAASSAAEAQQKATQGKSVVNQTIATINTLATEISETATAINHLGQESEKVGAVLDVIRGIAEQTNLLALNAAIEAARAGEQGRGFAVVADEVRTLASRTHESTQEIQKMIASLQDGARASVQRMQNSNKAVDAGVQQAASAGAVLESVLDAVARIADMNTQIASAAEEQSAVTEEVDRSIINIRDVANHTVLSMEQTAQTSAELASTAGNLKELVERFKV